MSRSEQFKNSGKTFEIMRGERNKNYLTTKSKKKETATMQRQLGTAAMSFESESDDSDVAEQDFLARPILKNELPEIRVASVLSGRDVGRINMLFKNMKDDSDLKAAFKKVVSEGFVGEEINKPIDDERSTLLHCAALANDEEMVLFLLERGADANIENKDYCVALILNLMQPELFEKDEDLKCARILLAKTNFGFFGNRIVSVCQTSISSGEEKVYILRDNFYNRDLAAIYEKTMGSRISELQPAAENQELLTAFEEAEFVENNSDDEDEIPGGKVRRVAIVQVYNSQEKGHASSY